MIFKRCDWLNASMYNYYLCLITLPNYARSFILEQTRSEQRFEIRPQTRRRAGFSSPLVAKRVLLFSVLFVALALQLSRLGSNIESPRHIYATKMYLKNIREPDRHPAKVQVQNPNVSICLPSSVCSSSCRFPSSFTDFEVQYD